ncbi:uncharacterized protein LOC117232949 [Bombus vosnesenskii]|uniref:Uncharacterized protein LOC117232949 n=1 Tax=Bombus vosnesenskii TaxID=207650 RepID=A0A6J3K9D0_9HYME|nr:uncharacterized protein LOC117232949 [Bombus vosnesenskii]
MASIYALFLTLILVFSIVVQLQMLIADPKKLCTIFHYYATNAEDSNKSSVRNILQHYSKEPNVFSVPSSDSKISLTNLRTVSSWPVIPNQTLSIPNPTVKTEATNSMETEPNVVAKYSSTFVKTDQVLPVVDITWDYNSYRFKTFESCLRNCYGDRYPPGEVVLNSMQLNLLDSHTNVPMNVAGLFDFMKEESEPRLNTVSRKLEIEYLNPLDHFVTKQPGRPETMERFTETDEQDRWYNTAKSQEENDIGPVITGREKNQPNRRSSRKIEAPCKCYLSSSRRVCGTNDS